VHLHVRFAGGRTELLANRRGRFVVPGARGGGEVEAWTTAADGRQSASREVRFR
jgi:hypothetical protein